MIAVYTILTLVILLLSLVVVFSFLKYRFKGDRSMAIVISYYVLFLVIVVLTVTMLKSGSTTISTPPL